ncbi:MAG: hypothetical protein QNJ12_12845 [Ilumatobacter sp.]|uniref:hypothetical protein n=1 Tax=Ilumatobacter sp. TaxID=1967498 RepID=UPI00261B851B|nr:hypothetical protein [Ilumatobacter sp.]MDJ0769682.1 hypothetical protein [Ilumatobacter sp.]
MPIELAVEQRVDHFEVPLTGQQQASADATGPPPPVDWRRTTALASLAGVALGVIVAALIIAAADDDPAGAPPVPTTTGAATAPASAPPLGGQDTLPAPAVGAPGTTSSTVLVDAARATTPAFPPVVGLSSEEIDGFNLAVALGSAGNDLPRVATTSLVVGRDGFTTDVEVERDPVNDRYEVRQRLTAGRSEPVVQHLIIDVPDGFTYIGLAVEGSPPSRWERYANDLLAASAGLTDMRAFAEPLLLGPVRLDSIGAATVDDTAQVVELPGGRGRAREFRVTLPADAIPSWAPYALGPVDAPSPSASTPIAFTVYVTGGDEIRRVDSTIAFGSTTQSITHEIVAARSVDIALPPGDRVFEGSFVTGG